jgi:tetratricopeptide (TPR) repeat protein
VEDSKSPQRKDTVLGYDFTGRTLNETVRSLLTGQRRQPSANAGEGASGDGVDTSCYDEAFRQTEKVLAEAHGRVKRERQLASTQWAALEGHPPARRLVMVRNDERLCHWGLYDLLLEKSQEAAAAGDAAAMGLAELSVAVAERLDPEVYGEERVADFKTAALAALGDARRLAGDLAGARLAFSQARIQIEMGTGDLLEEANLLGSLTNLLCDLGEYSKAAQSLERASALFRRMGDRHLLGATLPAPEEEKKSETGSWRGASLG